MAKATKKQKKKYSLFLKFILMFAFVEVFVLSAFGCAISYFVVDFWEDEQLQTLYDCAYSMVGTYTTIVRDAGSEDPSESVNYSLSGLSKTSRAQLCIVGSNGTVLYCSDTSEQKVCSHHKNMKIPGELYTGVLADNMLATRGDFTGVFGKDVFVTAATSALFDEAEEPIIVFAVQSAEAGLSPYFVEFIQIYITVAIGFLIITGIIIYFVVYNTTKPLKEMSEATKRYSKSDFSYRIKTDNKSNVREFEELAEAMNLMADSLEKHEATRSNFVANVSHELKTPMTTIGGFIDGILDGTIDKDNQERYLTVVSDEIKRLSKLVASMLNTMKMEAGEIKITPGEVNLFEMIFSIIMSFEQKLNEKSIDVNGLANLQNILIEGDNDMLTQVFFNLVDNALKFSPSNGEIVFDATENDEEVTVKVINTGAPINDDDLGHLFERFYKSDKSRSLDINSTGLGLYIVKNIIDLHGGSISVRNKDDSHVEFTVILKKKLTNV